MNEHEIPTPVALYARVSSDRQDVDLSIAAQLRALREHADKNGYVVVREFVDEAESGRVADRPQFQEMLDEAKSRPAPFGQILVWKFSRFTRKREHAVAFKSMLRRRESGSSPSPSRPTTPPPADSWKASSRPSTSSIRRILPRTSPGGCGRPRPGASGCPARLPWATTG